MTMKLRNLNFEVKINNNVWVKSSTYFGSLGAI